MKLSIKCTDDEIVYLVDDEEQNGLPEAQNFDILLIENFSNAQDLAKIISAIIKNKITCNKLFLHENEFGGNVCCDALIKFIKSSKKIETFKIIEIQDNDNCMSNSDHARLSLFAKNISITLPDNSLLVYHPLDDFQLNHIKVETKFDNYKIINAVPSSYFFNSNSIEVPSARTLLRDFFSIYHQQRTVVTCGAACALMVMEYYNSLRSGINNSKKKLIIIDDQFAYLPKEKNLAQLFHTNEEGTDVNTMAKALDKSPTTYSMGITTTSDKEIRQELKNLLQVFEKLLDAGVPVIVNHLLKMGTEEEEGHFSVIVAIENNKVILADPATRYDKKVQCIEMSMGELIGCWRSETGNIPGKYFVLFPSEITKEQLMPGLNSVQDSITRCSSFSLIV